MSNCVFNFNFLAFELSEILRSPKFTLGGLCALYALSGKNCTRREYFTVFNGIFNFNFLALAVL